MATNEDNGNIGNNTVVIAKEVARVPPDETISHWLQEIDGLVQELGSYLQALTPADRQRMPKIRLGGERHVDAIAETASRYGLSFPGGSVSEIRANVALVTKLTPVLMRLRGATEVVSDTILRARGDTWRGTTSAYTMLSRMAKNMPSIATDIAPVAEFFARRRKSKAVVAPPGNATPGNATPGNANPGNANPTGGAVVPVTQPSGGDTAKLNGTPSPSVALEK